MPTRRTTPRCRQRMPETNAAPTAASATAPRGGHQAEAVPAPGDSPPAAGSTNVTPNLDMNGGDARPSATIRPPSDKSQPRPHTLNALIHSLTKPRSPISAGFRHSFHFLPRFRIRTKLLRKSNFLKGGGPAELISKGPAGPDRIGAASGWMETWRQQGA